MNVTLPKFAPDNELNEAARFDNHVYQFQRNTQLSKGYHTQVNLGVGFSAGHHSLTSFSGSLQHHLKPVLKPTMTNSVIMSHNKSSDVVDRLSGPKITHDCPRLDHRSPSPQEEKPKTFTVLKQLSRSIQHAQQHKEIIDQLRFGKNTGVRISVLEPFKSIFDY